MKKPQIFAGNYKGYTIRVFENDEKTFISAIENEIIKNTIAENYANSFKYATAYIENKLLKEWEKIKP